MARRTNAPRWRADGLKTCLLLNFDRRGWVRASSVEDMDFYWASVANIRQLFSPETRFRLRERQLINHFQNHFELTRKDLMCRNLKRYRRDMEKEGSVRPGELDFLPTTYHLPADIGLLVEEFRRNAAEFGEAKSRAMWIIKPSSAAQGKGIVIINSLSQAKRWAAKLASSTFARDTGYVCSRYISNPLLIGGRKFDLRIFVLVTSYRPLKVWLHEEGFARFCLQKYRNDSSSLDNPYMHLTNVAIQKKGAGYNAVHGGKWSTRHLRLFVDGTRGAGSGDLLFERIEQLIVHSLKAVQTVIVHNKHCFECYGYDVLVDDDLNPYLIEVNASPSLSSTTVADRQLKTQVIGDILDVLATPAWYGEEGLRMGANTCTEQQVGGFKLIYDETD